MKNTFGFGTAVELLKAGHEVARSGWNGKGQYLSLQSPDANSKMTSPYIYLNTVDGGRVPWVASQTDILSEDWTLVATATGTTWVTPEVWPPFATYTFPNTQTSVGGIK